jgi:polar amino acid transport system substrate-binding protein
MMKSVARTLAVLSISIVSIATLSPATAADKILKPVKAGIADQQPYSGLTADGTVTGFAPEVAGLVLQRLNKGKLVGLVATYAELVPGLNAGRWDMIAASLSITTLRCRQVLYADPILLDSTSMAVPSGNPGRILSIKNIRESGKKIGILSGSFLVPLVKALGVPDSQIVQFPDGQGGLEGLKIGRIDAFLSQSSGLRKLSKIVTNNFTTVGPLSEFAPSASSVAFKLSDRKLRDQFNREIRKMKRSGELDQILIKWGFDPIPEKFLNFTAERLCKGLGA